MRWLATACILIAAHNAACTPDDGLAQNEQNSLGSVASEVVDVPLEQILKDTILPHMEVVRVRIHDLLSEVHLDIQRNHKSDRIHRIRAVRIVTDREYLDTALPLITYKAEDVSVWRIVEHITGVTKLNHEILGDTVMLFKGDAPRPARIPVAFFPGSKIIGRWESRNARLYFFENGTYAMQDYAGYNPGWLRCWRPARDSMPLDGESRGDGVFEGYNPMDPNQPEQTFVVTGDAMTAQDEEDTWSIAGHYQRKGSAGIEEKFMLHTPTSEPLVEVGTIGGSMEEQELVKQICEGNDIAYGLEGGAVLNIYIQQSQTQRARQLLQDAGIRFLELGKEPALVGREEFISTNDMPGSLLLEFENWNDLDEGQGEQ